MYNVYVEHLFPYSIYKFGEEMIYCPFCYSRAVLQSVLYKGSGFFHKKDIKHLMRINTL